VHRDYGGGLERGELDIALGHIVKIAKAPSLRGRSLFQFLPSFHKVIGGPKLRLSGQLALLWTEQF
jgi:hypothetical protein